MIHTLNLNPALDMRMRFANPRLGELNRAESVVLEPSGKGLNWEGVARQGTAWGVARALVRGSEFPNITETEEVLGQVRVENL